MTSRSARQHSDPGRSTSSTLSYKYKRTPCQNKKHFIDPSHLWSPVFPLDWISKSAAFKQLVIHWNHSRNGRFILKDGNEAASSPPSRRSIMPCAKSSQISLGLHHRQVQRWRLSWFLHKQVHIFYQSFWDWILSEVLSQKALSICQMHWWLRWGECKAYANCYMDGGYGDGEIAMSCSINIWFDSDGCLKIVVNNVISPALLSFSFVMITGPCADGYGVCCLNFVTACQSNVKKNVSYIQVNSWTLLSPTALSLWHHHHHHHTITTITTITTMTMNIIVRTQTIQLATQPQSTHVTTLFKSATILFVRCSTSSLSS